MAGAAKLDDNGLSVQESLFCDAYFVSFNATEAAKQAGYSERSAYSQGAKLLERPHVQRELARRREQMARKFKVTAERVLEELAIVGFSSKDHYLIDENGHVTLAAGAPASAIRAVSAIKRKTRRIPQGKDKEPIIEHDTEIRLWSKTTALHDLGDYLKLFGKDAKPIEEPMTKEQREAAVLLLLKTAAQRKRAADAAAAPKKAPAKKAASKATPQARRTR